MSTSETGHAVNVSNLEKLISFCVGYGTNYNPKKSVLQLASLTVLLAVAKKALGDLNDLTPVLSFAVNKRQEVFEPLSRLITRVSNAVEASDVGKEDAASIKTLTRKLQGKRAAPKKPVTPGDAALSAIADAGAAAPAATVEGKSISASQLSFDQRIENMDKLVKLLAAQPGYDPNEEDLTVAGLTTLLAALRGANTAAVNAETPVSNARIARDTVLYAEGNGVFDLADKVKSYVKSVFGGISPQYKQVSKLKFVKNVD